MAALATAMLIAALSACHSAAPPPLSAAALAAVAPKPGVDRQALARAIDDLFTAGDGGETRAVLVLRNGRVIAERYAAPYTRETRFAGWSMAKSVTGVLIGLLVSDGRLRLDEPAPIPLWQRPGDPRGEITLRELLQMRSGLRHVEQADPAYDADTVRMLFLDGRDDMAAYAEAQPLAAEPGSQWHYSTATGVILADLAARVLAQGAGPAQRRMAVAEYLRTRLFEPAGLRSMAPEYDAAGTMIGGSMADATARDWGRFGEFLRNGGAVRGAQVVPRDWIRLMTTPAPHAPFYGAQLWLNRAAPGRHGELFPDRAPPSLFACVGHLGQYVIVSPAQHLVLVRLGKTEGPQRAALRARLADIVSLFGPI